MIITLTDFGNSEYLGVMKGVIYSTAPKANITDLYNEVDSYNIKEGAWILLRNYKFFPKNSIFLCVVDPGVGSSRKSIIIETENYLFVGPDNGLMYPAAADDEILRIAKIEYLEKISSTFHGRDVFSVTAAKLEKGLNIDEIGEFIHEIEKLNFHLKQREGEIVRIDKFGNIITNIPALKKDNYNVTIRKKRIKLPFFKTYAKAPEKKLFLIEGSSKTLEISIKEKEACKKLKIRVGDKIKIE
ncbi:SAM-dependent chlorinase/fluorinase [Candidatus Woesearchaeota archaeon]|nr:SAM-dependent chlorinase/fluorinase [Candidatus Woesearchaeota archaeon]